jgi:hypothetical protein
MNFVGGGVGHIAYHGSPHKFNKFSLDKIGTGEGAQAYGHGLYLAETPGVAQTYQKNTLTDGSTALKAKEVIRQFGGDMQKALGFAKEKAARPGEFAKTRWTPIVDFIEGGGNAGSLYKTDIPDEAVARMLDWDKPLSQQSEAVQSIIARQHGVSLDNYRKIMKLDPDKFDKTGKEMVTSDLFANGIPGIRYLDGGSRSAGQGSSNFVVFDPEMIRILERNGVPTGQKPWNPNEYRPLSDLMNPRID